MSSTGGYTTYRTGKVQLCQYSRSSFSTGLANEVGVSATTYFLPDLAWTLVIPPVVSGLMILAGAVLAAAGSRGARL